MWILFLIAFSIIGFPAVIFLDYHKKHNIHQAIWFVFIFYGVWVLLQFWLKILGLEVVYYLWLIPVLLFGILFLKTIEKIISHVRTGRDLSVHGADEKKFHDFNLHLFHVHPHRSYHH